MQVRACARDAQAAISVPGGPRGEMRLAERLTAA
jgi:hypothetical protein